MGSQTAGFWRSCSVSYTGARSKDRRPQTNGKVERYHRTLLEEWAYIRPWTSETERHAGFTHFYNHHRSHGALQWATPAATLTNLQNNVPADHTQRPEVPAPGARHHQPVERR